MTTNHPAHGPVSLDRLHQISEILSKAAAQSDGGNLGYAMADVLERRNADKPPVHPTIADEKLDDETLQELIEFRRSTFEYHSKEGHEVQTIIHGSVLSAMLELQERRKADSEPMAWQWFYLKQWHVTNDPQRAKDVADGVDFDVIPLYAAPPAPVVECPFPCGWDNLNKLAIQDAAFVARGLVEGETITEEHRQAVIVNNDRLMKIISTCRAAMFQAGNHTEQHLDMVGHSGDANEKVDCRLPFAQWLSQQNEPIDVDCGCVTTEAFYHWLRVAYEAGNSPVTPDGYVLVPKKLTAENGAKGVLSGEFSETKFINCPECFGEDECETCDGSGRLEITVPVTWTTIKAIWAKGVEHFAAAPQQEANNV